MLYLDNAATSFPKPRPVLAAMRDCARACGNPGRGGHSLAMRAAETVYACREVLAEQFGSGHPENVIFTMNATMALNFAIKGLACAGDHILISDLEHNAVRRPVAALAAAGTVRWTCFRPLQGSRTAVTKPFWTGFAVRCVRRRGCWSARMRRTFVP